MRAKWLWMTGLTALVGAAAGACGQGQAVFNVDVLSFLSDSTVPYDVPGGVGPVDSTVSKRFSLPGGFSRSTVDSVSITGAAGLHNFSGGGTVVFDVFFAKNQGSLFTGTPYLTASSGHVTGDTTLSLIPPQTVSLADTVFHTDSLWVGIRARVTTDPPLLTHMIGQVRLTELRTHIVLNDKFF